MDAITPRLWWDGRRGEALADGVKVLLDAPPAGIHPHLGEIDYAPSLRHVRIRESAHAWRDMEPAERVAVAEMLKRMADAARAAVTTEGT